jgi:ABC-type Zn uptake system ZnuABC Zn-binding protein ZnuA
MPGYIVKQLRCLWRHAWTSGRITGFIWPTLLACCCLALLAGPARAAAPVGKLPVTATIVPLGDFCRKIGGDLVQVRMLLPIGSPKR